MAWTDLFVRADAAGGGDGTVNANSGGTGAFTLAEAITHSTTHTGIRYNVKTGTFVNTTTSRSFSASGTTTAPIWWRGFSAAIGDLDNDFVTALPLITFTTGLATFGGAHQIFSNLSIQGANTGRQLSAAGSSLKLDRVWVENTNAAAGSHAVTNSGIGNVFLRGRFKATASATRVFLNSAAALAQGSVFTGGGVGLETSVALRALLCSFRATGSHGIQAVTTGNIQEILGCTFRGCGGDGIRYDVLPTSYCAALNCLFASCGGYGINNNTGANTNVVTRLGNDFWNNTSGTENGFGDSPSLAQQTESSDPHVSATDLSLVTGALAKNGGVPGVFEGESYTSYLDIGAVQRVAGGSVGLMM